MRVRRLSSLCLMLGAACGSSSEAGSPPSSAHDGGTPGDAAAGPTGGGVASDASTIDASKSDASASDASARPPTDAAFPQDATFLGEAGAPRSFTVTNRCSETVWAAALPSTTFPGGVVAVGPGDSFQVGVDNGWSGRIWGKVQCTTNGAKLTCASDPLPSSLAEFTLTKTLPTGLDFYDVSLVDGFNLPIQILAMGHTPDPAHPYNCGDPACTQNLNATCPAVLQSSVGGEVLACANDECKVLGGNDASSPDCVYPNQYTEFFKMPCPTAYSYPFDDPTSTFTCEGLNDYAIVFCP